MEYAPLRAAWSGACRLDIAAGDWHAVKAGLKAAYELCEGGGDWERKNRLKVPFSGL